MKVRDLKLETMSEKEIAIATHLIFANLQNHKPALKACRYLLLGLRQNKKKLLSFLQSVDENNCEELIWEFDLQGMITSENGYEQFVWRSADAITCIKYGLDRLNAYYSFFPSYLIDEIDDMQIDMDNPKNEVYANSCIVISENELSLYRTNDLCNFLYNEEVMPCYQSNMPEKHLLDYQNNFCKKWHIFRDNFGLSAQLDYVEDLSQEGLRLSNAPAFILDYDGKNTPEEIYWFKQYETESWLRPLLDYGVVIFEKNKE